MIKADPLGLGSWLNTLVPSRPWVLHSALTLGALTEGWIDTQVAAAARYPARLLGSAADASMPAAKHWLVAENRLDLQVSARCLMRSQGLSGLYLAAHIRSAADGRLPALVHAHFGGTAARHLPFSRALSVPLVASFYGADAANSSVQTRRWRRRYSRLFDEVSAVIVEGPALAERLTELGCPTGKISVVRLPTGVPALCSLGWRPRADFVATIAGRFVEKKGFDTAIRAFARALRGRPDARLQIIGTGKLEPMYRSVAVEEQVESQIDWLGALPFSEFARHVASSSVALFPSRSARDGDSEGGAPVTLIDAQWLGVPAIVSDHDDLPFVAAASGSVVVPSTAVDDWAEAMLSFYQAPEKLKTMSAAAEAFARAHHSPEANVIARENVYDHVLRTGRYT